MGEHVKAVCDRVLCCMRRGEVASNEQAANNLLVAGAFWLYAGISGECMTLVLACTLAVPALFAGVPLAALSGIAERPLLCSPPLPSPGIGLVWTWAFLPETNGLTLDQVQLLFQRSHSGGGGGKHRSSEAAEAAAGAGQA